MYAIDWTITERNFDPASEPDHHETVFTLGNGYLGTRGTFEEGHPGSKPATLINGVYDKVAIVHTELANCPDWLPMVVSVGGEYFSLDRGEILHYERQLDMQRGILRRQIRWRSPQGKTLDLHFERFTSLAEHHVAAIRLTVTPLDFSDIVEIQAGLDGHPDNQGIKHWKWINQGLTPVRTPKSNSSLPFSLLPSEVDGVWMQLSTLHSGIELGMATQLAVKNAQQQAFPVFAMTTPGYPSLTTRFDGNRGETVTVEKLVTIYTSRDTEAPTQAAIAKLSQLPDYDTLRDEHTAAWARLWEKSDVVIEGDLKAQQAIRYNLFQLLQAAPHHESHVSIPAKTLSGFAYRGHVFWDTEIFLLPFLSYTQPAVARNALTYRYHTLAGARRKAADSGYEGAMFAWESAATGDEFTPRWVPDAEGKELVRIWCGDIELHITSDVAYAVWNYWQITGDDRWMADYGAELILDTAVFWGSRAEWNRDRNCYEIRDVIGPDENHDRVNNNTFTNRMMQWHLETAQQVLNWLQDFAPDQAQALIQRLHLTSERLTHWNQVIERIYLPTPTETGLIEQSEGFFALKDVNLADYEPRQQSMQAILGIETTNQCQILKQPDVLMLLYLLGDHYDSQTLKANWDYYCPRTDHVYGSSLGPAIHAVLAAQLAQPMEAYQHFMRAALVDLEDVRGNACEGIHAASTGGVWQAVVFGFAGIRLTERGPIANPHLPPGWTRLKFKLSWRDRWYEFDIKQESASVDADKTTSYKSEITATALGETLRGVIFDLDGVLTDTAEYHYLGWKQLADEEGIPFDREANEAMRGLARRESLLTLLGSRQVPEAQMQEMMDRKNRYYVDLVAEIGPQDLLPGALEFLMELQAAGIQVAIGSSSKNAHMVVERLGIGHLVQAIADGYSVSRSKPAPDLFLHAAELLGIPAAQCIVFEDADSGVEAAKAAGMWAVGLGPVERFQDADLVLPSLEYIQWKDFLDKLAQTTLLPSEFTAIGNPIGAGSP